jgi:hypothetical protein
MRSLSKLFAIDFFSRHIALRIAVASKSSVYLAAIGMLCISAQSSAVQYFVAISGNDGSAGTMAAPFLTVNHCAQIASAGDTCTIRAGTYRESVRPALSGSASAPITFEAYRREEVTISGADIISGWSLHNGNIYKTNEHHDSSQSHSRRLRI